VSRDGTTVGILARPFVLERSAAPGAILTPPAPASFAGSLPVFDKEDVLEAGFLDTMLDAVARRTPALGEAMIEARGGRYGTAALEALAAGDQDAAAFLRGLDFFVKGQLNEAATQLQLAAGPRRTFFPAAFYLGACFAAAGRDREAAGVWQSSLGAEPRPAQVYAMAADARMRDGQPASAIDILAPAYAREPGEDTLARRLGLAYVTAARFSEAIPVLDAYLARHATDEEVLLASIVSHYEAARAGQALSNVDREKLRRYAAAYMGTQAPLVEKYMAIIEAR
jgi:Flp pilus assembly protein TadD